MSEISARTSASSRARRALRRNIIVQPTARSYPLHGIEWPVVEPGTGSGRPYSVASFTPLLWPTGYSTSTSDCTDTIPDTSGSLSNSPFTMASAACTSPIIISKVVPSASRTFVISLRSHRSGIALLFRSLKPNVAIAQILLRQSPRHQPARPQRLGYASVSGGFTNSTVALIALPTLWLTDPAASATLPSVEL